MCKRVILHIFELVVSIQPTGVTEAATILHSLLLNSFLKLCFLLGLNLYATLYSLNSFSMKLYVLILFF